MATRLYYLLLSFRPLQWTKNFFIFAGLLFSQNITNFFLLYRTVEAFFIFCLISGIIYTINDIFDVEQDRQHPQKSNRPVASGKLPIPFATWSLFPIALATLFWAYTLSTPFFLAVIFYCSIQLAYSSTLKHIVILDVFCISAGFVIRVMAGALVINVYISPWLIICTILLSLFLALSKRRHELVSLAEQATSHRKILQDYSSYMLDQMISVVTASTLVSYALYTISEETVKKFQTTNLIFTFPFVLYGILRYLYLIHKVDITESPEKALFSDKHLLVTMVLWVITVGIILYN